MKNSNFFITGTDTGIGKTVVSCMLANRLKKQGKRVLAVKPFSTGGYEDAIGLLKSGSYPHLMPKQINPIMLAYPSSPKISATLEKVTLSKEQLLTIFDPQYYREQFAPEILICEGVGGVEVPMCQNLLLGDIISHFAYKAIIVVPIQLGAINHVILTKNALMRRGVNIHGWIANLLDPEFEQANCYIQEIESHLNIPLLFSVNFQK